jgi:DNA-binding transcriptional MerR regulator
MREQLLSPRDAGRLLGLSTPRLQQLDREGRLKALRDSAGRRFYTRDAVEAFRRVREQVRKQQTQR